MSKGNLFVFSGASGVGKSTVLSQVMAQRQDLQFSVSATTRPPRPTETHGVDYCFVSWEEFQDMIAKNQFVEYDAHMGNLYGTPIAQLDKKLLTANVVLDIEPAGALAFKAIRPEAVLIFIAPPSLEELERRLRDRGDTDEDQIRLRSGRVQWEMEQSKKYDHIVINDQVEPCVQEILNIIAAYAD